MLRRRDTDDAYPPFADSERAGGHWPSHSPLCCSRTRSLSRAARQRLVGAAAAADGEQRPIGAVALQFRCNDYGHGIWHSKWSAASRCGAVDCTRPSRQRARRQRNPRATGRGSCPPLRGAAPTLRRRRPRGRRRRHPLDRRAGATAAPTEGGKVEPGRADAAASSAAKAAPKSAQRSR